MPFSWLWAASILRFFSAVRMKSKYLPEKQRHFLKLLFLFATQYLKITIMYKICARIKINDPHISCFYLSDWIDEFVWCRSKINMAIIAMNWYSMNLIESVAVTLGDHFDVNVTRWNPYRSRSESRPILTRRTLIESLHKPIIRSLWSFLVWSINLTS